MRKSDRIGDFGAAQLELLGRGSGRERIYAHRGHPLLGDVRYGAKRLFDGRNLALHCYYLEAPHPVREQPLALVAPLPASWIALLGKAFAVPRVLQEADAAPGD